MASKWWRFWSGDSWKAWWELRPEWSRYRTEVRTLAQSMSANETRLLAANQELTAVEQQLVWAEELEQQDLPIKTSRKEIGLGVVSGVALLAIRTRQGNKVWVPIDHGVVYLTSRRAVFAGSKEVQFQFDRISLRKRVEQGLYLEVSSRKNPHILAGPADKISALMIAADAVGGGHSATTPFITEALSLRDVVAEVEGNLDDTRAERRRLVAPERPISPAWIPAALAVIVLSIGASAARGNQPEIVAAQTTTTTPTPTTVVQSTSTLQTTSTLAPIFAGFPLVGHAEFVFGAPVVGPSGDPKATTPAGSELVTVVSITDGDTLDVRLPDGTVDTVRLIGINSPESGECFSEEASLVVSILAPVSANIGMTIDQTDRDQYGRLLRYLWFGGMSINEEMVRRGAAIARRYPPDIAMADRLEGAQADAQLDQIGLWEPTACGPDAGTEIAVIRVEADAPGNDHENLNGEYVWLRNNGDVGVDLTDWVLKDESSSHRYDFPAGFVFAAGADLRIYTGCGTDTQSSLFWCSSAGAVWNNDGDTAFVLDQNGNTVTYLAYIPLPTTTTTTTTPATTTTIPVATTTSPGSSGCHPSYIWQCVPIGVSDVDCLGGSGNGPYYTGYVKVVGYDEYGLDSDGDGYGCENS